MKTLYIGVFAVVTFVFPAFSQAATLYMDPVNTEIKRGEVMTVALRLDTDEDECVNVADVTVEYPESLLLMDTSRGNSILSVWLEEPVIDKANRKLTFAGGIPNGYCGRIAGDPRLTNVIMELVFSLPGLRVGGGSSDVANIVYGNETRVLLNDGFGTDAALVTFGSKITLSKEAASGVSNDWAARVADDNQPPEDFAIKLEKHDNAFNNRYFIVFNTTDKQSGIDYYEVIEEPMEEMKFFAWGATNAPWVKAKSPYILNDQSLNSVIRVRAYDKAGNEFVASLVPEESIRKVSTQSKIMIAIVVTLLLLFVGAAGLSVYLFMCRRKHKAEAGINDGESDDEEDEEYEYEYRYEEVEEEYDEEDESK